MGSLVIIPFRTPAFWLWEPSLPSARNTNRALSAWFQVAVAHPTSTAASGYRFTAGPDPRWDHQPWAVLAATWGDPAHWFWDKNIRHPLEFPSNISEVGFGKRLTSSNQTGSSTYPQSGVCNKLTNIMINSKAGEAKDANIYEALVSSALHKNSTPVLLLVNILWINQLPRAPLPGWGLGPGLQHKPWLLLSIKPFIIFCQVRGIV